MTAYEKRLERARDEYSQNRDARRARMRELYRISSEDRRAKARARRQKNLDRVRAYDRNYWHAHRDSKLARQRKYIASSRGKIASQRQQERKKSRKGTDLNYRIWQNCRIRINAVLSNAGIPKTKQTSELLGCSVEALRAWIESKWKLGMIWGNWQLHGGWHIDHIRPVASFDLSDVDQQRNCFHYTNLQPLWEEENKRKAARWNPQQKELHLV